MGCPFPHWGEPGERAVPPPQKFLLGDFGVKMAYFRGLLVQNFVFISMTKTVSKYTRNTRTVMEIEHAIKSVNQGCLSLYVLSQVSPP